MDDVLEWATKIISEVCERQHNENTGTKMEMRMMTAEKPSDNRLYKLRIHFVSEVQNNARARLHHSTVDIVCSYYTGNFVKIFYHSLHLQLSGTTTSGQLCSCCCLNKNKQRNFNGPQIKFPKKNILRQGIPKSTWFVYIK